MTPVSKIKYWPLMPFKIPDTSGALSKLKELILLGYSLTGLSGFIFSYDTLHTN